MILLVHHGCSLVFPFAWTLNRAMDELVEVVCLQDLTHKKNLVKQIAESQPTCAVLFHEDHEGLAELKKNALTFKKLFPGISVVILSDDVTMELFAPQMRELKVTWVNIFNEKQDMVDLINNLSDVLANLEGRKEETFH